MFFAFVALWFCSPDPFAATNGITSTQVTLAWTDNSDNEASFKLERRIGLAGVYAQVAVISANGTNYVDAGLSPSTVYFYRVRASNADGDSDYSNEITATTLPIPPPAPSALVATSTNSTQSSLVWADNATNEVGFKIERKIGLSGVYAQIATVAGNIRSFTDSGLAPSTQYYYRVRATNAGGDSAYSNEAGTTTTPGSAPSLLTALTISATQINVAWTDNAINETGFKIERKTGQTGTYSQIATVASNVVTYIDAGAAPATQYYYRVKATIAVGDSAYSNESSATTLPNRPASPSLLVGSALTSAQIKLTWTDNATNETGFKVERKTGAGGTYAQIGAVTSNVATYTDAGLSGATLYYYRLRATNPGGDSAYGNEATATTLPTPPPAPGLLAALATNAELVTLTWMDSGTNETAFKIERKVGSVGTYFQVAAIPANVFAYSDTNVLPATQYFYRARASNAGGDSAYSNESSATTKGSGAGLTGSYYNNASLIGGVDLTRTEGVDFDWASGSPGAGINADAFSVSWTGQLEAPASGSYSFRTVSDGGLRLWINGSLIIDNWTDHTPTTNNSASVGLVLGSKYNVVMEYRENLGTAVCRLQWQPPGLVSFVAVPADLLYNNLPSPWLAFTTGSPGLAGSESFNPLSLAWTINGPGADDWSWGDQYRFVSQTASGDCDIRARVTFQENTDAWAKAGVLIRENALAATAYAQMVVSPGSGYIFQGRTSTGGMGFYTLGGALHASPNNWVRLVRSGTMVTAYTSGDGIAWTQVGSFSITMSSSVEFGLAVTAHKAATLSTAVFDNVTAVP